MNAQETELVQLAYDAYGQAVNYKNYQGLPMPGWNDLGASIQQAWYQAARTLYWEGYRDADNFDQPRFSLGVPGVEQP